MEAKVVQEIKGRMENASWNTSHMVSHLSPNSVSSKSETFVTKQKSISSSKNEYIPKVRKPYTITKQREKWTEEEHQKFLEALKLYSRAWRHIEEHVGTKTAIQIRSHAQKFFSKCQVARDSSCEADGSLKPIEIPPPRPKKKPLHPYPRKMVDLLPETIAVPHQPVGSFSTSLPVGDRDNLSPTSVLPTMVSELHNRCLSPTSCTTDVLSANFFPTEKDNDCMTFNSSAIEEKGFPSSVKVTSCSTPDNKSPSSSIKLFGKMVMVTDSPKPSSPTAEDNNFLLSKTIEEKFGDHNNSLVEELPPKNLNYQVSHEMLCSSRSPCTCGSLVQATGFIKGDCNHVDDIPNTLPWCSSCKGSPFPYFPSYSQTAVQAALDSPLEERLRDEERQKGGSGSSSGSVSEVDNGHRKPGAIESQHRPNFVVRGHLKGFVPYKRCVAERDAKSLVNVFEEREGQKVRVCS